MLTLEAKEFLGNSVQNSFHTALENRECQLEASIWQRDTMGAGRGMSVDNLDSELQGPAGPSQVNFPCTSRMPGFHSSSILNSLLSKAGSRWRHLNGWVWVLRLHRSFREEEAGVGFHQGWFLPPTSGSEGQRHFPRKPVLSMLR